MENCTHQLFQFASRTGIWSAYLWQHFFFLGSPEWIRINKFTTSNLILFLVSFCTLFSWLKILSTSAFWPTETFQNVISLFGFLPPASLYSTASATELAKLISIVTVHSWYPFSYLRIALTIRRKSFVFKWGFTLPTTSQVDASMLNSYQSINKLPSKPARHWLPANHSLLCMYVHIIQFPGISRH